MYDPYISFNIFIEWINNFKLFILIFKCYLFVHFQIEKPKSPFTDTAEEIDHSKSADVSIGTSTFLGQDNFPSCPASVGNNPSACPNLDNNNCGANSLQHNPFLDQHIPEHGQRQTQSILRTRDTVVHSQLFQNLSIDFSILNLNIWNTNSVIADNSRGTRYIERIKNLAKVSGINYVCIRYPCSLNTNLRKDYVYV